MQITKLRKHKGRLFVLFSFDEEIARLDASIVKDNAIREGTEISPEDLELLQRQSDNHRAKEKALWLLSLRDHSQKELKDKIKKTEGEEAAQYAVEMMQEYGYVDDESFAKHRAKFLMETKHYSIRRCEQELILKGINRETARNVLDDLEIDEEEILRSVIERKFLPIPTDEKALRRTVNALIRLGYNYNDIRRIMREYNELED